MLEALVRVWETFAGIWPLLAVSALIAAFMKVFVDQNKVASFLKRKQGTGVLVSTATAVSTPLCSCGTTAVILGMMANTMPWAPIVAFMVASPLTSPQELFYSAGLFGWPFALAFFGASVVLGLLGGLAAYALERKGWLVNQARFRSVLDNSAATREEDGAGAQHAAPRVSWRDVLREFYLVGRQLLAFFLGFAFIGYVLNGLIPEAWITAFFGSGRAYGVPLAATLGLPLYINTEASMPLVRSLIDNGMSQGSAMAFLITGAGTSIGAIVGALTIARWRVVGLVIGILWGGAIIFGYAYNALLARGFF
ncbi:hypothetical protein SY88_14240 [Clostridiales bacterium PH28_bin88]|nr:hypothetical protein SY88_14240 [Clostridiales bacterium PH28_bin88]